MAEIWTCSNDQYHSDPRVGSTMLKTALYSPAEYRRRYVDENRLIDDPSDALILGSAFHCLVLEPENFNSLFCCRPPNIDGRTTDGKEKLAAFRLVTVGKTELTAKLDKQAKSMAAAALAESVVVDLLKDAVKEQAIVWDEDGIACKCKPDLFIPRPDQSSDLILDLKSADDPTPECFGSPSSFSPIRKYRYDLQMYHYSRGVALRTGRPCSAGLIVTGKSDPWDTYLYDLTPWLEIGYKWWQKAMNVVRTGPELKWRRPEQDIINQLSPSQWDYNGE
jgi:hypothetical protein